MSADVDLRELAVDRSEAADDTVRPRRQWLTRYVLPAVLIVGFVSLIAWSARDLVFPPKPVTVVPVYSTNAVVHPEGTPLFQAAGWIEARPTPVRVAALAPGVVEELLVVEDQPVAKGEPIAELVKDDAQLAYERSLADLELRQAELEESQAALTAANTRFQQPVHLQAELGEADASLAKINTELKNLPFQLQRAEADAKAMQQDYQGKLASQGVVAGVAIDIARSKAESAQALVAELRDRSESLKTERQALSQRRDALRIQLELLADELKAKGEGEAKVKAAMARVTQARVVVAEAKLKLDRMSVVSPIDGRVFRLIAHPGARIGSGMTQMDGHDGSTVVTLYRPDMLQVRVDVRFEDIPNISLKQPVEIDNPALPSPLEGKVLFVSSEADIQKNTLEVKVEVPDPPPVFKPEMLVDVTFLAPRKPQQELEPSQEVRLYVPEQLVHTEDGSSFVWLADQSEGVARKTTVETGTTGPGGLVEIFSGLTVSSRIISSGIDGLQYGDRIKVREEETPIGSATSGARQSKIAPTTNRLPTGGTR